MQRNKILIRRNKKADVPVTILVIGIFAVCTLALLSFINSDKKAENSFSGVKVIEKANMNIERHTLNHYYDEIKVKKIVPKWSFRWIEKRIVFSVEYNP